MTPKNIPALTQSNAHAADNGLPLPDAEQLRRKERVTPPRFRLLPITMTMAALLLCVKMNALYQNGQQLRDVLQVGSAHAEEEQAEPEAEDEEADAKPEEAAEGEAATEEKAADEKAEAASDTAEGEKAAEGENAEKAAGKPEDVKLASLDPKAEESPAPDRPREFTQIELDILQSLAERREELERRAEEMDLKEKLLEGTELRINDKLNEIKQLKTQVDVLLKEYNEHEDKKISGLVKIYETMKPKDAAIIFNELDMPILLQVVDRMSSRKVAPVLAGMAPERARELTIQLAEYRRLKELPQAMNAESDPAAIAPPPPAPAPVAAPEPEAPADDQAPAEEAAQ